MNAPSAKFLLFVALLLAPAVAAFTEGEWEYPANGEAEPAGGEGGELVLEEPEPDRGRGVSAGDTLLPDEPRIDLLADTFPLIRAENAVQPQPRNPRRILDSVEISILADKLEADRLLLAEIRKEVPEAREEAELYLMRLKVLAEKSDPVRLAPLFDRVLDQAPIYFKWLETEYEDQDEQLTEYYVGGARGFAFAMENFKSAVFLVIINRLDIASRVISALEE